jgi:TonB-linked SusC/RagA family outer membrane protein
MTFSTARSFSKRNMSFVILILFCFNVGVSFAQEESTGDTSAVKKNTGDEILNTGYGMQKKREIVTSVSSLKSDEFNKGNIIDPLQLIQGKIAGLSISKYGSDPNTAPYVRLRGMSTIMGIDGPLIVIDGFAGASLNNVDPNDIESIDVLRDAAAAAIYGIRGSGGVILVTTKKGNPGKTLVKYNVYATSETVAKNNQVMSAGEWRDISAESGQGTDYGFSTNWLKEIEQTALSQVHNISISGGSEKSVFHASINYRNGNGILKNTGYNQINGRINIRQKALNDKLTLDVNLGATERESQIGFSDAFKYATIMNPTAPVRSDDPQYAIFDGYYQNVNAFRLYNPVSIIELNKNEKKTRVLSLSVKGTYEILKGLNIDALYAVQNSGELGGAYLSKKDLWSGDGNNDFYDQVSGGYYYGRGGFARRIEKSFVSRLLESTIRFNRDISSTINLSFMGGYSYQDFTNEGFTAQGGNFLTDDFTFNNLAAALDVKNGKAYMTSDKNTNKLSSLFVRINLNFNNLWFITASERYEGSSRLGSERKWSLFQSFGTGLDFAKLFNSNSLSIFKLRIDYGITGNQPAESYLSIEKYSKSGNVWYNGLFIPSYYPSNNANPLLKSEKKREFDTGLDFTFTKLRLTGSLELYSQTESDLLYFFNYGVSVPPNVSNAIWLNSGKIKSHGMELNINYNVINKPDFSYNLSFNYAHNSENKFVSLSTNYNGPIQIYLPMDIGYYDNSNYGIIRVEPGKPLGQMVSYVFQEVDQNGSMKLADTNKDGQINSYDRQISGNGLPKYLLGLGNSLHFKNWDLNIFLRGVFGHNLVNTFRASYEAPGQLYFYNIPKSTNDLRNATNNTLVTNSYPVYTNLDVENASFVSLDNMCIAYNFKISENSKFSKLRVYAAGNNLFYISKYTGSDPNPRYTETDPFWSSTRNPLTPGIDRINSWPRTRSLTFGANVIF